MLFTTAEILAIKEEFRLNRKRLDECTKPHDFSLTEEKDVWANCVDGSKLYRRYTCANCGGKVSATDKHWYEQGLSHGKECKQ
jgi:hypothetical protein